MHLYHRFLVLLLLAISFNSVAVKFKYQEERVTKEVVFGDTKIIRRYQFTKDDPLGDH